MFTFECPHCQQHISADASQSGMSAQCPTCGADFVVPQASKEIENEDRVSEAPDEEPCQHPNPSYQPSSSNLPNKSAKVNSLKSRKKILAAIASIVILTTIAAFLVFYEKEIPDDITNHESVEKILDNAVDHNQITIKGEEGFDRYCSKNGNPYTGWIKGTRYFKFLLPYGRSYGVDYVNLLHVTNGKIDKEWSFYAGNTNTQQYEIHYDTSSKTEKHGIEGVKSFKSWKPNGKLCVDTNVENGNGVAFEYDYHVYSQLTGGKSNTNVDPPPTKLIRYSGGKITSIEEIKTEVSEKYAALDKRNAEDQEQKGKTPQEIALRKNMLKAYPGISFDSAKKMADKIFGETSSSKEENQRNRLFDDIVLFQENTGTALSEALDHYKHWREVFSSEMLKIPQGKFDYECGRMVADTLTGAMRAAHENAKASAQLGLDPKGSRTVSQLMNALCSYHLAFTQGYQGYIALRAVDLLSMPDKLKEHGNKILTGFECSESRSERVEWNKKAKEFCDLHAPSSDSEKPSSNPEADQQDVLAESSKTNQHGSEPPLAPLSVFQSSTIEEARECVQLLDAELKNNPENQRVIASKTAIMDVFKSEASLMAALNETKDAAKEYRIKMQNLQVASRTSPLTGRVNTTEVERIKREAEAIKATSEDRVEKAKADLKRTIDNARSVVAAPDREILSRVWDQVERRNNL